MFDEADLKLTGTLLADRQPVTCSQCDTGTALELRKRGPRETWPAFLTCLNCGHSDDHAVITNGMVDAAMAARTGRTKATDSDTFNAAWRSHTLEGECVPEFVLDDALTVIDELRKQGKKELRQQKTKARRWWRGRGEAARKAIGQARGAATSTALAAAWDLQTGGAGATTKRAARCRVKGCKAGWLTMTSRIHSSSGTAEQMKVACATCRRAY